MAKSIPDPVRARNDSQCSTAALVMSGYLATNSASRTESAAIAALTTHATCSSGWPRWNHGVVGIGIGGFEPGFPPELCPLSNVRTGVIKSVEVHPLRQYFDAGIPASLNTDDPMFFGNSLAMALESAQRAHRLTRDEIRRLMLSTIEATWLSAERKKRMAAVTATRISG